MTDVYRDVRVGRDVSLDVRAGSYKVERGSSLPHFSIMENFAYAEKLLRLGEEMSALAKEFQQRGEAYLAACAANPSQPLPMPVTQTEDWDMELRMEEEGRYDWAMEVQREEEEKKRRRERSMREKEDWDREIERSPPRPAFKASLPKCRRSRKSWGRRCVLCQKVECRC